MSLSEVDEEIIKSAAVLAAMAVRIAIEEFHAAELAEKTIKNDQRHMKEFNTLVRDAIYTALYALEHQEEEKCRRYVNYLDTLVPSYWEEPKLVGGLKPDDEASGGCQ